MTESRGDTFERAYEFNFWVVFSRRERSETKESSLSSGEINSRASKDGVFYIHRRYVIVAVRAYIHPCNLSQRYPLRVYTCSRDEQSDSVFDVCRVIRVSVCVRACALARSVGRSVRRWRRRAFPFRIAKVQRAIPRCAYFYVHTPVKLALARRTNNSSEKKKNRETLAERILRNDSTVSSPARLPLSFVLALLTRELICRVAKTRSDRTFERSVRRDFPSVGQIINAKSAANFSATLQSYCWII